MIGSNQTPIIFIEATTRSDKYVSNCKEHCEIICVGTEQKNDVVNVCVSIIPILKEVH